MKYYYDYENDCFLTSADLAEEFEKYHKLGYTEAETAAQYISNVMDTGNVVEISEHVYDGQETFHKVKTALRAHVSSYHAYWHIDITEDGRAFALMCEGEFICAIEVEDVIPALDYLYSIVTMESSCEEDAKALDEMVSAWGL